MTSYWRLFIAATSIVVVVLSKALPYSAKKARRWISGERCGLSGGQVKGLSTANATFLRFCALRMSLEFAMHGKIVSDHYDIHCYAVKTMILPRSISESVVQRATGPPFERGQTQGFLSFAMWLSAIRCGIVVLCHVYMELPPGC